MVSCFSLSSCNPQNQPKFLSFLKAFFSSSPRPFVDDDHGAVDDSDVNNQVIILAIRQRAMIKARGEPKSSFMIMTAEELRRLIKAATVAPLTVDKYNDVGGEKKDGEYEEDDDNDEFFSVRSCFSRCSSGDDEYYCSGGRTTNAVVTLSEEWFRGCEGWPFGLWRRRKVVVLPPLPKSPADSWTWHKRNLSNVKV